VGRAELTSLIPQDEESYKPIQDTLLAFIPTVFEPIARNASNRSAFGTPIRPNGTFGNINADTSFFSTPQAWTDFALGVQQAGGPDISPETYEYMMRSYGGILGQVTIDLLEHSNARGYAPGISPISGFVPKDKSRYYYEVNEKWRQIDRFSKAYGDEYEILSSQNPDQREILQGKNPRWEQVRKLKNSANDKQSELRKKVKALQRERQSTERDARIVDLMDDLRQLNLDTAIQMEVIMDAAGDVKR